MTKHPIEVITSVERRRRWSLEDRERLVRPALSQTRLSLRLLARRAFMSASCSVGARSSAGPKSNTETATTLVPVIVADTAHAVPAVQPEPPATSHPRRKRSDVTIELGRGRRVRVDSDIDTEALGRILDCVLGRR